VGLLVVLYKRERSRRILEKTLFAEQKRRADEDLDNARQALQSFTERMLEKNELIQQITKEIEALRDQQQIEIPYQLYHKPILTANDWDDFKSLFEKVHPTFFYHQKQFYPQLTPGEVRLLTLIKLQLSSAEMATILGVSAESVKKSRQRLRKKLQPDDREKDFEVLIGHW
jgi:DNA-binding transcriptional regulator YiaG